MTYDPHGAADIPVGTPVVGFDGSSLGQVREAYPHYVLVRQEGQHEDLNIPVHAILSFEDGKLQVSVNRGSASEVDHEEAAHHLNEDPR